MAKRKAEAVGLSPKPKISKPNEKEKVKVPASGHPAEPLELTILDQDEVSVIVQNITEQGDFNGIPLLLHQMIAVKDLLSTSENSQVETCGRHVAMGLYKVFQKLLSGNAMDLKHTGKKLIVAKWLLDKYTLFQQLLLLFLSRPLAFQLSLQLDCLDIYLALVRAEASAKSEFPLKMYQDLVHLLVFGTIGSVLADETTANFILLEFVENYFAKYWDLQCYFFDKALATHLEQANKRDQDANLIFANILTIIKGGLLYTADSDTLRECRTWIRIPLHEDAYKANFRTRFQNCFFETLKLVSLTPNQYKALLGILHKRVIPFMGSPASLMDFLTDAYDQEEDPVVQILAMNSLYDLMRNYNLEYPDFYTKLYLMLTPQVLLTRYRSRFFRLCDLFLSSTHLAASLVASFIKRLSRLLLTAAAPAVVIIIPFIYNLLKRHPICMVLLQNARPGQSLEYTDPFSNDEKDPLKTGAMGSSLWELETLMSHYHPNIATLAKIFGEPFRKPSYNMEDFLDWSYITLLESEKTRKYKGMASVEYEEFDSLFAGDEKKLYISNWTL